MLNARRNELYRQTTRADSSVPNISITIRFNPFKSHQEEGELDIDQNKPMRFVISIFSLDDPAFKAGGIMMPVQEPIVQFTDQVSDRYKTIGIGQ